MSQLHRQVLVCYDVASTKARSKLFDALKCAGLKPLQESVFWGWLRRAEERQVGREFEALLDPATDKAFLIPVSLTPIHAVGYLPDAFEAPPRSRVV